MSKASLFLKNWRNWNQTIGNVQPSQTINVEELVLPEAGQKFQGDDFRALRKPGVYIFMQAGVPLYVGYSKSLLGRIGSHHKQAARAIEIADEILLFPCVSEQSAIKLETLLIGKLKPRFNVNRGVYAKKVLGVGLTSSLIRSTRFRT